MTIAYRLNGKPGVKSNVTARRHMQVQHSLCHLLLT